MQIYLCVILWLSSYCRCFGEYVNQENPIEELPSHRHNGSFIGFTAWKTSTQQVEDGDIVMFEGILLNEGEYFYPQTGRFICPYTGVYFASVSAMATSTGTLDICITMSGQNISHLESGTLGWARATNSVIFRCEVGELVHVKGFRGGASVYGDPSVPHTTFTVMMMAEIHDNGNRSLHTSFSGFSAWKMLLQSYSVTDTITFGRLIYNEGDNFRADSYVCPATGTYYVTVSAKKLNDSILSIGVEHNSLTFLSLSDSFATNRYNQITTSGLRRCEQGERFVIKATAAGAVSGSSLQEWKWTTFSAMLIYAEDAVTSRKHSGFVGCSVWKKANQDYAIGDNIAFDGFALNDGGHFSPVLSHFTCPVSGVYYLSVTMKKLSTNILQVNVVRRTLTLFRLQDLEDSNPDNTLSGNALTRCSAGDVIKVLAAGSGSVYGETNQAFTNFNVFIMYQDPDY